MVRRFFGSWKLLSLVLGAGLLPFGQWLIMPPTLAASPDIVISEVLMENLNASQEFIELYNNSSVDVPLGGWTLQIQSASGAVSRNIPLGHGLRSRSHALLVSTSHPSCSLSDFPCFSGAMSFSGGHVVVLNKNGVVVDKLGWGTAVSPETTAAATPALPDMSLSRRSTTINQLQDSDNNLQDFEGTAPLPNRGGLYELPSGIDVCPNIAGLQETLPDGYEIVDGNCQLMLLPDPDPTPEPNCQGLSISEVVPNPAGDDNGREFIELYNQTNNPVDLTGCILKVGTAQQTLSGMMDPGYRAFYGLTLPNSAGGQVLLITNAETLDVAYPSNMKDDEAYGLVEGVWMQGLSPSPGEANLRPVAAVPIEQDEDATDEPEPCPEGKFRNPETNRCKNLETTTGLAPCDPGQERNPETNRCRKVTTVSSTLTPCAADQIRNPETNRCKKAEADASTAKPCPVGQARNPETNRCRKVASANSTNPMAKPAKATTKPVSYYVLGLVALLGLAYAIYEYRHSIYNFFTKHRKQA